MLFMYVTHSGWNEKYGAFHYDVYIDENKTDYELHYKNGMIAKQSTPFHEETRDWNCDQDVYPLFGAWFRCYEKDGSPAGGNFWTPEDLVRAALDCQDPENIRYGNRVIAVPGIELPPPHKRPNLADRIRRNERQIEAQTIERNRKMNTLGIRPPNEPWAR